MLYYELCIHSSVTRQAVTTPTRDEGHEKPQNMKEKSKVIVNKQITEMNCDILSILRRLLVLVRLRWIHLRLVRLSGVWL